MGKRYFTNKIVKWYSENSRPLPWRETADPYRIWLSEVILQQTRVAQGLPYYHGFVSRYPSIELLASATEQEVMRLWQGLGYYTRARNLHKCAKTVVALYNGKFPATFEEIIKLPGIGPYTAAAIASFAFGEKVAVVDGNVFRVLSRIFGIEAPVNTPEGRKEFTKLANELLPRTDCGQHNQAIMEFGALLCTPQNPKCSDCPFKSTCVAFQHDLIQVLPAKIPGKKSRRRYFYYLVVEKENALLMKRREEKDIWHGLFDFVLIEKARREKPETVISDKAYQKFFQKNEGVVISRAYKHILTHQVIHCRFIQIKATTSALIAGNGLSFYSAHEVAQLPKPALITRFLTEQKAH